MQRKIVDRFNIIERFLNETRSQKEICLHFQVEDLSYWTLEDSQTGGKRKKKKKEINNNRKRGEEETLKKKQET